MKDKVDSYVLSVSQMPQDMCEKDVSDISQKALRYHEQEESPLPANYESVLKPGNSLRSPGLRHTVKPENVLAESRKEDVPMINHEVCE